MNKKLGMMALTGALALVACSQGGGSGGTTNHTLKVTVSGLASTATSPTITVTNTATNAVVDTETGSFTKSLPAGTYSVSAGNVTGYTTPSTQTANLNTADAALNFTYTATTPIIPPTAKTINLVSIKDMYNVALPVNQEVNANKNAYLFAAQNEESVCVIAKLTDANNNPVANTTVNLTVTGADASNLAVSNGCLSNVTAQAATNAVTTDSTGTAKFTLFATYGINPSGRGVLDLSKSSLKSQFDDSSQPIKIVVQANDASGNSLTPLELKGFFLNMSHLYVRETTPGGTAVLKPDVVGRTGSQITAPFVNVLTRTNPNGTGTFEAIVDQKQPQVSAISPMLFGGYVIYTVTGADSGSVVLSSNDPADTTTADGLSLSDFGTPNGVTVALKSGVTVPSNRPLAIDIKANYVYSNIFSPEAPAYQFPLKDITFHKQYSQGLLSITKYVDHHVLSWVSNTSDPTTAKKTVTLADSNELGIPAQALATYTITIKNNGNATVYNASVADQIPPELGVVTGSISNGGTYDAVKHAITWNYTNDTRLATVTAGQSMTYTFQVYARQKPGFEWTLANPTTNTIPLQKPPVAATAAPTTGNVYSDPYAITDGDQSNDTTVAYFPSQTDFGNQVVTDYTPVADESTINIVRPLFRTTKLLQSENTVSPGGVAVFQIKVTQLDRVGNKADTAGLLNDNEVQNGVQGAFRTPPSYAGLFTLYPGEFNGTTANPVKDATGTQVTTSDTRQNPYGTNLNLADTFQTQLDFTNATALTVTNPVSVVGGPSYAPQNPAPGAQVAGQSVAWANIPLFQGLDTATTQIFLTLDQFAPVGNSYINCAYLNANNLNQPARGTTGIAEFVRSWYALNAYKPWVDGRTFGAIVGDDEVSRYTPPTAPQTVPGGSTNLQVGEEACATVGTIPNAGPNLAITTKGEYTDANPVLVDANKTDPVANGSTFNYKEDVTNSGGVSLPTATLTYTLANANATFAGGAQLYRSSDGGVTFTNTGAVPTTQNGNTVVFSNVTVPAGSNGKLGVLRAVLPTTAAVANSTETLTGQLDYNGNVDPNFPKQVTENTTILP